MNLNEPAEFLKKYGVTDEKIIFLPAIYLNTKMFYPKKSEKIYDIIFVGRLESNKGISILLDALTLLKEKTPDVRLLILGKGSLESNLENRVQRLGLTPNVTFIKRSCSSK